MPFLDLYDSLFIPVYFLILAASPGFPPASHRCHDLLLTHLPDVNKTGCQSWLVSKAPGQAGPARNHRPSADPRCRWRLGPASEASNGMRDVGIPCPGSSTYRSCNQVQYSCC